MNTMIITTVVRLLLILPFLSVYYIFACNSSYEKNVIVRSNREYDYFGNVLEYEYDYFPSYSSTCTSTQKVLEYKYTSTITPSLNVCDWVCDWVCGCIANYNYPR